MTQTANKRSCFIETYGCQMNKADSERMLGLLAEIGYQNTEKLQDADLLILNTCTIREGAADRAYSNLGRWADLKKQKPEMLIGLAGCLAQEKGQAIQKRMPHIDLVFGTHNLHRLPDLVLQVLNDKKSVCELYENLPEEIPETPIIRQTSVTAWVNVILGCDFNCTYCIVPQVRGREKSRSSQFICGEVRTLAQEGFKEVTLLGQNVTAYGQDINSTLASLLRDVHQIEGIERIRFLTGHPHHVDQELIETVAALPKVCEHFHIPMQAGDDETLRRMARIYTVSKYEEMVGAMRSAMPRATVTSDFIVGFPGETERQFLNTCAAVERIGFDSCITAMYSPRRGTKGGEWEKDDALRVPEEAKRERLRYLNALVDETVEKRALLLYEGSSEEILIEGVNSRNADLWQGRTRGGKLCLFPVLEGDQAGDLVKVNIDRVTAWSLFGSRAVKS